MVKAPNFAITVAAVVALLLIATGSANAYVDPGTGSYLLQVLVASLLASLFVIKGFWRNIRSAIGKLVGRHPKEEDD